MYTCVRMGMQSVGALRERRVVFEILLSDRSGIIDIPKVSVRYEPELVLKPRELRGKTCRRDAKSQMKISEPAKPFTYERTAYI